jgi:tetratricopeptide (TPR) repeat protein
MSFRDEPYWLVKSSQRLIGPVSANEIYRRLKSRELNLNDETSSPGRRWQQIQNHPDFRDFVDEIRRNLMSEETEVSWTPGNSTQTLTDFLDSELTEDLTDKMGNFTRTAEIVIHELPVEKRGGAAGGQGRFQADAFSRNPLLQKKADRTARWLWLVTAIVLIAGIVVVWQKKSAGGGSRSMTLDALRAQVPETIQAGDFSEALNELKSYFPDPLQSGELGLYMGPLMIQIEGQTVLGKRILSQMIKNQQGDPKLELTAMGVADLIENQIEGARQNFERALAIDKEYVPALINRGVAEFQLGRYKEAQTSAMQAIHINPGEGEAQLLLAEAAIYLHQKNNGNAEIQEAVTELNNYRARHLDYEPEAIFYTIYLDWLKTHKVSDEKLGEFLEMDPQLTADHRHNVFIYKGPAQWSSIGRFCQQMADQLETSSRTSTLKAVCFSKEGRKLEARTWVEKAINQAPTDALAQTWYSYVLNENGMGDQASVALGRAGELNRKSEHTLPILMQARFSQAAGDYEPAKLSWNRLYSLNDKSISALGGLAQTHAALGSHKEATGYIDKGLTVSPDYIPLLKLKLKSRKEGWYGQR